MNSLAARTRYSPPAQLFHWLTVLLVGAAYLTSVGGPESRVYAAVRASDLSLHETFGVLVVVVLVLRLGWRLFDRAPAEAPLVARSKCMDTKVQPLRSISARQIRIWSSIEASRWFSEESEGVGQNTPIPVTSLAPRKWGRLCDRHLAGKEPAAGRTD